jgi:hypothetical protein
MCSASFPVWCMSLSFLCSDLLYVFFCNLYMHVLLFPLGGAGEAYIPVQKLQDFSLGSDIVMLTDMLFLLRSPSLA